MRIAKPRPSVFSNERQKNGEGLSILRLLGHTIFCPSRAPLLSRATTHRSNREALLYFKRKEMRTCNRSGHPPSCPRLPERQLGCPQRSPVWCGCSGVGSSKRCGRVIACNRALRRLSVGATRDCTNSSNVLNLCEFKKSRKPVSIEATISGPAR